jgi:hypothetical protein
MLPKQVKQSRFLNIMVLWTVVCGLWTANAAAQNHITDTTAEIVTYWKQGESRLLQIVNTREKYFNEALVFKTKSASDVLMTVQEARDTTYVIDWLYKETTVSETEEPIAKRLAEISNGFRIEYQTNETGMFQKLLNYAEMEKFYAKGMEKMYQQYGVDTTNDMLLKVLESIFVRKEIIDGTFTKEIKLFHMPFGAEYNLNKTNEEIITLPHPFMDDTIQTVLKFQLTKIDLPGMMATLECVQQITRKDSERILNVYHKKMEGMNQKPDPRAKPFESIYKTTYDIELVSGWLSKVTYEQTSIYDHITQKDITTITTQPIK